MPFVSLFLAMPWERKPKFPEDRRSGSQGEMEKGTLPRGVSRKVQTLFFLPLVHHPSLAR